MRQNYSNLRTKLVRFFLICCVALTSTQLFAVGWTPSDAGLIVNLEQGERFLLSVWIDMNGNGTEEPGEELFVSNYNRYSGGYFGYSAGAFMKLLPATEVTEMNEWSVGAPLNRGDYALGGIAYTIWNDGKTLKTSDNFKFLGELTSSYTDSKACDVVFVIPTNRGVPDVTRDPVKDPGALPPTSFDPGNTLGRGAEPFDGATGTGFLGMTYREVYMFDIPRANLPRSYTNAALVTFNTTLSSKSWSAGSIAKGKAAFAFADSKYDGTTRTLFRLYRLDKQIVSCPNTYFFATDEQDYKNYRKTEDRLPNSQIAADSTAKRKIYTIDYFTPMERDGSTNIHRTDNMYVPVSDSTYYYVGYKNDYYANQGESPAKMGTPGAFSQFTKIRQLPLYNLSGFYAPTGAYGCMVIDSTSAVNNHAVAFEPAGYMLKVSTGKNVPMVKIHDNEWVTQDMWEIDEKWLSLKIWATMMSGPEFSESDPGIDIPLWTDSVRGDAVPVQTGGTVTSGMKGYAVIYTNDTRKNGNMTFVLANTTRHVHYDNNGCLGVQIPDQYPLGSDTIVTILAPRIKYGYKFLGWTKDAAGATHKYQAGDTIRLSAGETVLYAQATYDGTVQVALSFMEGGKRYFLTQPGMGTGFRYARARSFDNWENTLQGMADEANSDPNYLSTFELRHPSDEVKAYQAGIPEGDRHLNAGEKVLDPRRYTMKGYEDTLMFYEHFAPEKDEYLGLFYMTPNTILANNTWAGLFTTTSDETSTGWPDYITPYISSAKLLSTRYVIEEDPTNHPDSLTLMIRSNSDHPYVQYDPATNQFNGVANENAATVFQLSAVVVADAHYVVIPDSTNAWRDTITFGFHQNEPIREAVWSSLIGKQLMAAMRLGDDTVYFHPNSKKIINDPNNLYLSSDFRISQTLELIRDSRVSAPLNEGDSVQHETTDYHWHNDIVSGNSSPMNVKNSSDQYIDIIDTFRITVSHSGISKIKEYRGLWKKGATGLHVSSDGSSRYRDVIIRTKTYHYGDTLRDLVLEPVKETYSFGPLAGHTQQVKFRLKLVTSRRLYDSNNAFVREEILSVKDTTSLLSLQPSNCTLAKGSTFFNRSDEGTVSDHVTLSTVKENTEGVDYDTLRVSETLTIDGVSYTATNSVPLIQTPLEGDELIWSVKHNGQRYFIMAGKNESNYFIFRQYTQNSGGGLRQYNTNNALIKGSKDAANSDTKYITPWQFSYTNKAEQQLTLRIGLTASASDTLYFKIASENTPAVDPSVSTSLTYEYTDVYANTNANFEEQVLLRYGDPVTGKWLKFDGTTLVLTENKAQADTFSWTYLKREYVLQNNGNYPNMTSASFAYNSSASATIKTPYMAYREYTMLLDNKIAYLCKEETKNRTDLTSESLHWKTTCAIDIVRDSRTGISSGLTFTNNGFDSKITPTGTSPLNVQDAHGNYIDIVDTLRVTLGLQTDPPTYQFKSNWSEFKSISDGNLKIPLVRKTYYEAHFDSLDCVEVNEEYNHTFPATITPGTDDTVLLQFSTIRRQGTRLMNTANEVISVTSSTSSYVTRDIKKKDSETDSIIGMHLNNKNLAEVRLIDKYGNTPTWCKIKAKGDSTLIVQCLEDGIRSPRSANLYLTYVITIDGTMRIVTDRLTVSQLSRFDYKNNQTMTHTSGASGDPLVNGIQQVHENRRILYYYPEQDVELPVRDRHFFGWWRWYREGNDVNGVDVSDSDVPNSLWRVPPRNVGTYNYPFRIIGDSVMLKKKDGTDSVKVLVTMGRYTVFHYKAENYKDVKKDPPAKNVRVAPPITTFGEATKPTLTYAVDISNYYDNLPMSLSQKNQIDTAMLDTIDQIIEPTLSLREIFELRPWTEMAAEMEKYKDTIASKKRNLKYMEDHVVMAPTGNVLLLSTEQRYNYDNVRKCGLSESLLGYYMRDDHWSDGDWDDGRKDSMIWCGGWDADCLWYTFNPKDSTYTSCDLTVTESDDFLQVPKKSNPDTVYYCLRARSQSTTGTPGENEETEDGAYWFNICRYMIIYHDPNQYGPKLETTSGGVAKAIISKEEIEQRYEVLERLNFDYIQPGSGYHVYPHPLPWADASYGYTYPETSDLPHNRLHKESDFPNHGEYGLINRIPYSSYWYQMEQHGGAANGYMIYCDGMSSSGQVAALTLETHLCAGQKMFFSGYVGNPSSQKGKSQDAKNGKSEPNFIFSVQGSMDGTNWEDITSYMTGSIPPSNKWYQIYFPIVHNRVGSEQEYSHFRVRIYNVSSDWDGNDFIIDDMCIFATKPPLIAYQAQTTCQDYGHSDDETHVLLRVDYQGITGEGYNGKKVCYTVRQKTSEDVYSFVKLSDQYLEEDTAKGASRDLDTLYGKLFIPAKDYVPLDEDSIYTNMNDLIDRFDTTLAKHQKDGVTPIVRVGYIYEILEGDIRPVKYVVHSAKMNSKNDFTVHMSGTYKELLSSICGMTSHLKISSRMVLELNGEEQPETEQLGLCANATYDISLRVKGSMYRDSVAPIDVQGTCANDWLLYGDTADDSSLERYGFKYSDIKTVITEVLRCEPTYGKNANQFARTFSEISRNELIRIQAAQRVTLSDGVDPYALLDSLVSKGFLMLYKSNMTASVISGDSVQYVIFPIVGSGSKEMEEARVGVCPNPILIKLKPNRGGDAPLIVGGLKRDSTELSLPITILASSLNANNQIKLHVDSIMSDVGIYSVELRSTDDPGYIENLHHLRMEPDKSYPSNDYYGKGDSITLRPASTNNYTMQPGYQYTFNIVMQTKLGQMQIDGCDVGTVPFTVSVVPDYVRWNPKSTSNSSWNDADNWLGIDANNTPIHDEAHFVPMENTMVIIPASEEGKPYPVVQPLPTAYKDSIQKVGFQYNKCNTIRVLPNAAIGNQQYISNADMVIDMSLPHEKWALRSAPVKGMISGDLFMAQSELNNAVSLWEVGAFDASGRNYTTGNATYWLSLYSSQSVHYGNTEKNDTFPATAEWSPVTNGMTLSLPPASGWAVYALTKSGRDAAVRLPKNDDIYYYYTRSGNISYDHYEHNLQSRRETNAVEACGEGSHAGELAFQPTAGAQTYRLTNGASSTLFVFGNPTLAFIDIWGFIADNTGLSAEFDYINTSGYYVTINKETAKASTDTISEQMRYLPPMHAIVLKAASGTTLDVTLNTNRVVTSHRQVVGNQLAAPLRGENGKSKGIMTVTAINPVADICTSRLLLGQGYHRAIRDGEDAVLTTINVEQFNSSTPSTPFNIYASEGNYGLSIDLRDEIVNVPVSFFMSELPFDSVTHLWFTGVNNIDGALVLYDAWTNTERRILDGICLDIETPTESHQDRYYIRLQGYTPDGPNTDPIATEVELFEMDGEQAVKIYRDGQIYILRNGHIYTMLGQKVERVGR